MEKMTVVMSIRLAGSQCPKQRRVRQPPGRSGARPGGGAGRPGAGGQGAAASYRAGRQERPKEGMPPGWKPTDLCNICGKKNHWARECMFKECKRDANNKAIITPEDRARARAKMQQNNPRGVNDVETEGDDEFDRIDTDSLETGGLCMFRPLDIRQTDGV